MSAKVVVLGNEQGSVITVSENNPEYGFVKVAQVRTMFDDNGFIRARKVNALIPGTVEELQMANFFVGQELSGKILIKESVTPFNEKDPSRDLKIAGNTGIVCSVNGQPIYRKTVYNTSSNAADITLQHDNVEELRTAYASQSAISAAITPNEDFAI